MRRWIISDTHFGHSIIQKHCRRPSNVDEIIQRNWKQLIKPDDLVIHLGDVAFTFVNLKELMDSLPGRKILVLGNHDSKSVTAYMQLGFSFVCDALVMSRVYFTHKPVKIIPADCIYNIHGHLHNNVPYGYRAFPHCRLFGLEYEQYKPVQLEKFLHKQDAIIKPATGLLEEKAYEKGFPYE